MIYRGFSEYYDSMLDNCIDHIYFKSDQWASNWLYGSAGNNQDGEKMDIYRLFT